MTSTSNVTHHTGFKPLSAETTKKIKTDGYPRKKCMVYESLHRPGGGRGASFWASENNTR